MRISVPQISVFGKALISQNSASCWLSPRPRVFARSQCCKLAGTRQTSGASTMASSDSVPDVDIDPQGRFKYVLIKVYNKTGDFMKHIVRGFGWGSYHADIYEDVDEKLRTQGLQCECVGGGRILHIPEDKKISVFGYSQGYGRADHSISVNLLKKKYPDYTSITFSNDGY